MIVIAGKRIDEISDFSRKFETVTSLVEDASQWLTWAIADDTGSKYQVDSEQELLEMLCMGLHGSGLVRIENLELLIHAAKLTRMSEAELETLLEADGGDEDVEKILNRYDLATRTDLLLGTDMLRDHDLQDHILFQAVSLSDQIQLYNLSKEVSSGELTKDIRAEAADFASKKAQTPEEFCKVFRFYTSVASASFATPKKGRKAKLQDLWSRLTPQCNDLLDTFSLAESDPIHVTGRKIKECLFLDEKLGFSTKASVLQTMAANNFVDPETEDSFSKNATELIGRVKRTIVEGELEDYTISQDGRTVALIYRNCCDAAVVDFSKACGTVTLSKYKTIPNPCDDWRNIV